LCAECGIPPEIGSVEFPLSLTHLGGTTSERHCPLLDVLCGAGQR
jgi:hypothetical protein